MWAKWYTVGPQVYISTWPGVWVLNSSFLWVAELYRYMVRSPLWLQFYYIDDIDDFAGVTTPQSRLRRASSPYAGGAFLLGTVDADCHDQ